MSASRTDPSLCTLHPCLRHGMMEVSRRRSPMRSRVQNRSKLRGSTTSQRINTCQCPAPLDLSAGAVGPAAVPNWRRQLLTVTVPMIHQARSLHSSTTEPRALHLPGPKYLLRRPRQVARCATMCSRSLKLASQPGVLRRLHLLQSRWPFQRLPESPAPRRYSHACNYYRCNRDQQRSMMNRAVVREDSIPEECFLTSLPDYRTCKQRTSRSHSSQRSIF